MGLWQALKHTLLLFDAFYDVEAKVCTLDVLI